MERILTCIVYKPNKLRKALPLDDGCRSNSLCTCIENKAKKVKNKISKTKLVLID